MAMRATISYIQFEQFGQKFGREFNNSKIGLTLIVRIIMFFCLFFKSKLHLS